jgi:hypothetical protein
MTQVLSRNGGEISCTLDNGDTHEVNFEPTNDARVFAAEVEVEVAEHLLGKIGKPSFFKAKAVEVKKTEEKKNNEDDKVVLTIETYPTIKNHVQFSNLVKACDDKELLMQITTLENQREGTPRASYIKALDTRLTELE